MHLFASERPEVSPGQKAILTDGSAIPAIVAQPTADGLIRLQVMLRNYDNDGGYNWRYVMLPSDELKLFFDLFRANPEQVLEDYFNWRPKAASPTTIRQQPNVKAVPWLNQPQIDDFL